MSDPKTVPSALSDALPYHCPGDFARQRFGGLVFRVVVDAGFSCPSRDGTLGTHGCLFCSIDGLRPPTSRPELTLREQVRRALPRLRHGYPRAIGYLVYLQPYTNTYGDASRLAALIAEARNCRGALGVVVGTRPDALPGPVLEVLTRAAQETFLQVELGVQSTDDRVLAEMERGHTWQTSRDAIAALRERGVRVGAHMILGTPWESPESQLRGAALLSEAGVDAVKLHHLQVLRGSRMAARWPNPHWRLPSWKEYAEIAAGFLEQLDPRIVVERLLSRATPELLLAPRWEVSGEQVRAEICRIVRERQERQERQDRQRAQRPARKRSICFALVNPSEPGNVGAAARSLAAFDFDDLALIAPAYKASALDQALAVRSGRAVLDAARVVAPEDATALLAGFDEVWGATARTGRHRRSEVLAEAVSTFVARERGSLLVLFGPERDGLDRQWLDRCHRLVRIPARGGSLNLAHAVTVTAYELQRAQAATPDGEDRAAPRADAPVSAAERRELLGRARAIIEHCDYPTRSLPRHPAEAHLEPLRSGQLTRRQARWLLGLLERLAQRLGLPRRNR